MNKVIVVGLDGANWNVIDPWIDSAELPNLKKLKNEGVWGDLHSCLPPVTCPNWKCYSTGKNPGKLGVYWWERIDFKNRKLIIPSSRSFHSREIWDYLNSEGLKTGIINMPTTYPPKKVKGFMISGGPTSSEEKFTFPEELESRLKEEYGYRVHPRYTMTTKNESGKEVEEILDLIDLRFRVARDLLQENHLDFLHITIFYINVLQHFFWRGEPVKRGWKKIDGKLGEFLRENHNIFLISDHGSHPVNTVFYINSWLQEEGYLKTKREAKDALLKLGLNQNKVLRFSKKIGAERLLKTVPRGIRNIFPISESGFKRKEKLDRVLWDKTKAIASGQGLIYLNVHQNDYEKLRDELINKLESLRSPITGEKLVKRAYRREEVYSGEYVGWAPDLIFEQAPGVHTTDAIGKNQTFTSTGEWKAENITTGIFLAHGPDIRKGERISNVEITDIAPTVLHLMNVPIPADMDGRVLEEIFKN